MLTIIKAVHNKDLLHRDIKPDNFMLDLNETTNKLYLIDFGLAKRYNYDGKHISENTNCSLIGTPKYVSLNVHNCCEPSRRDDIESCIYVMIYMLFGDNFWFNPNMEHLIECKKKLNNYSIQKFVKKQLRN